VSDRNEASVELSAPPEAVFPLIVDPAERLRWIDGLVEAEEAGPGAFREAVEQHGIRVETRVRTVRSEPPRLVEAHVEGRGIEATVRNVLEATDDGGTRLTVTVDTRYRGLAARLVAPVIGRRAQASLERSLATLKQLVESEAPGPEDAPEQPEPEHA
jgi:carbon monoxide dehydrogenase subunit G